MTKRILSVVLVLAVFFGGYAILPKKFNPILINDVNAATTFKSGYYMCKRGCDIVTYNTAFEACTGTTPLTVISRKTYNVGEVVYLNKSGCDGANYVAPYVKNFFVALVYIDRG